MDKKPEQEVTELPTAPQQPEELTDDLLAEADGGGAIPTPGKLLEREWF